MNHRQRSNHDDAERRRTRATAFGTVALGIMFSFALAIGAVPHFNHPAALLGMSLLACPLSAWLATRCLTTAGAGSRAKAWIALVLVVLIVVVQVVELFPYIAPATWG